MMTTPQNNKSIVLFDGFCNLCSSLVVFIIKHDKKGIFLFLPVSSEKGQAIANTHNIKQGTTETLLLLEKGELFKASSAVLKIARHLDFPWNMMYFFIIVPARMRNIIYRYISRNRYRWFGKKQNCFLPGKSIQNSFF